jgi:hypothetical protein
VSRFRADKAIRSYDQIASEILEEAGRIDAAEDDIQGPARGDELPEQLAKRERRRAWLLVGQGAPRQGRAEKAEPVQTARGAPWAVPAQARRGLATERFASREYEAYYERA